jgi:hypothetical protein
MIQDSNNNAMTVCDRAKGAMIDLQMTFAPLLVPYVRAPW